MPPFPHFTVVDTIEHYYYNCSETRTIPNALREISKAVLNLNYSLRASYTLPEVPRIYPMVPYMVTDREAQGMGVVM